jgi:signal transduction histidine kinase
MLHEFLTEKRGELIERCKAKVAARRSPPPTDAELDHGVPLFLDQLIDTLRLERVSSPEIGTSATKHGNELLRRGFTVDQVVHDYGDVCQAVTELAVELNATIATDEFRTLNRCLDDAIADAVTEYGRQHDQFLSDDHTERLGVLAHEMRNLINSASLAFRALSSGNVGVSGSTASVLERSLMGLRRLVDRSLTEVRLEAGIQNLERIRIADFVEEVRVAAVLDANARGIGLAIEPVEDGLEVEADRQTLASVAANLLQNAFKFSKPGGTVTVRTRCIAKRVLIQFEDECGGLPAGKDQELFLPFEQRGADRSGLGLGLAICLRGVEANGGRLHVHDVPGRGCVFSIDLQLQPTRSPAV